MSDSGLSLASSSASGPVSGEGDTVEVEETESRECGEYEEEEVERLGECDNTSENIRSPSKRRVQARLTHGHGYLSKSVANLSSSK